VEETAGRLDAVRERLRGGCVAARIGSQQVVKVTSNQELKGAILSGEDVIEVDDPDLAEKIVRVHAIKQYAWSIAIVSIAAGITFKLVTGGVGAPATFALTSGAAAIVGPSAAYSMVSLALTLGGVTGLTTLRNNYKIGSKSEGKVLLRKK